MAIDSAEKRRAAAGSMFLGYGVTPNSSQDIEWRYQVGWSYSFDLASAAETPYYRSYLAITVLGARI